MISVVYISFLCKENPFIFFLILICDFLNKNQVILTMIIISDLNQADLNWPTLIDNKHLITNVISTSEHKHFLDIDIWFYMYF